MLKLFFFPERPLPIEVLIQHQLRTHDVRKKKKKNYEITPFPDFLQKLIRSGGLMNMAEEFVKEVKPT